MWRWNHFWRVGCLCLYLGLQATATLSFANDVDKPLTPMQPVAAEAAPALAGVSHNSALVATLMGMTALGSEWVLWLLLVLSVISLTIMLERTYYFHRTRIDFDAFMDKLTGALKGGDDREALALCNTLEALEPRVVKEAIESHSQGTGAIEKGTTGTIVRSRVDMERGLTFLGTMGNNAPFIGLFGTVLGIIQAFQNLSVNPAGGPSVVMAGISEALIATAVGLFVAIPAVIAFNWFQRLISQRLSYAEAVQSLMIKHYTHS